jgi:hypothetical protein
MRKVPVGNVRRLAAVEVVRVNPVVSAFSHSHWRTTMHAHGRVHVDAVGGFGVDLVNGRQCARQEVPPAGRLWPRLAEVLANLGNQHVITGVLVGVA